MTKLCPKCGVIKGLDEFCILSTCKDTTKIICSTCTRKRHTRKRYTSYPQTSHNTTYDKSTTNILNIEPEIDIQEVLQYPKFTGSSALFKPNLLWYEQNIKYIRGYLLVYIKGHCRTIEDAKRWEFLTGWTLDELKLDFATKYYDGMTWDSVINGIIDIHHIKLVSTFNIITPEDPEFKVCWALRNLRPMWVEDHIELHRKIRKAKRLGVKEDWLIEENKFHVKL